MGCHRKTLEQVISLQIFLHIILILTSGMKCLYDIIKFSTLQCVFLNKN